MICFRRILFPVDLSRQAREAVPFVRAMATRFDSELWVAHVTGQHLTAYPLAAAANAPAMEYERQARVAKRHDFETFVAECFENTALHPQILEGDAAHAIAAFALDHRIDLIMMPTHGYGPFRRLLLGSVTAKVLHDAACPVWTGVHSDEMWSHKGAGWHRFLCAIDEDVRDAPVLQWAAQFACEQRADLQVVHAVHAAAPIPSGEESPELRDFLFGVARERLEKEQALAGTRLDIKLALGPVGHVVKQAALDDAADLILIGRGAIQRGFGRLRSSAYAVIREAPCPVISL